MNGNICDYREITNLSQRAINERFRFIHRYLCSVAASVSSGTFERTVNMITTSTYAVGTNQSNQVFTNEGAGDIVEFLLPPASPGLEYTFIRSDVNGASIIPDGTNTIRIGATVSDPTSLLESAAVGDAITLVAVSNTSWVATSNVGSWTIITPP